MVGMNAAFDQQRKLEQYDYEKAKRDSELSMLPEKTAADRSAMQLRDAQSKSGLELIGKQTENASNKLALEGKQTQGALGRVNTENETKDLQAGTARDKALLDSMLSQVDVEDLPRAVQIKKQAGVLKDVDAGQAVLAGIAKLSHARDTSGLVRFINDIGATAPEGKRPASLAASVGTIPNPQNPDDKLLVALDEDGKPVIDGHGNPIAFSTKALNHFLPKPETKVVSPGATIGTMDNDGKFSPAYTAPGRPYQQRGEGGPSLAQQNTNQQIEISRRKLAGMDPGEIRRKTQKFTDTGRDNPDYDPAIASHARLAAKRKYGDDAWYDEQGASPQPNSQQTQGTAERFASDQAMKGYKLGKQTDKGFEVFNSAGKLVGHYE